MGRLSKEFDECSDRKRHKTQDLREEIHMSALVYAAEMSLPD